MTALNTNVACFVTVDNVDIVDNVDMVDNVDTHTQATIIGEEDDVDYDTEEARSLITLDTCSEVLEQQCPENLTSLNEEDLVIWVSTQSESSILYT